MVVNFYARDAMLARVLAMAVCLSVSVSVCVCHSRGSIETNERIELVLVRFRPVLHCVVKEF